jgi:hypothetical protein
MVHRSEQTTVMQKQLFGNSYLRPRAVEELSYVFRVPG